MANNVYDFLQSRNERMVELLDKNMSVSAFIVGLLDHLITYAEDKKVPFETIVLDQPFIGDDEYIRARIRIND